MHIGDLEQPIQETLSQELRSIYTQLNYGKIETIRFDLIYLQVPGLKS